MTSSAYWRVRLPWYPDGCFGPYRSATLGYSRRELLADFCVHAIGLMGGVVCSLLLGFRAMQSALPLQMVLSLAVYSAALLAMLGCSAAFNMLIGEWPSRRHALQLADHTGILLLIAGTYTPFMSLMCNTSIRTRMTLAILMMPTPLTCTKVSYSAHACASGSATGVEHWLHLLCCKSISLIAGCAAPARGLLLGDGLGGAGARVARRR